MYTVTRPMQTTPQAREVYAAHKARFAREVAAAAAAKRAADRRFALVTVALAFVTFSSILQIWG